MNNLYTEPENSSLHEAMSIRNIVKLGAMCTGWAVAATIGYETMMTGTQVELPNAGYMEPAQNFMTNLDVFIGVPGAVGLCTATAILVKNKVDSQFGSNETKERSKMIDTLSSRDLVSSGTVVSFGEKFMRRVGSGKLPVIASAAATVACLVSMTGNEIAEGPQRAIDSFIEYSEQNPDVLVVQDRNASPMSTSALSPQDAETLLEHAQAEDIPAFPVNKNLGNVTFFQESMFGGGVRVMATLAFGVPVTKDSPLYWDGKGCNGELPIYVDETADFIPAQGAQVNGMDVKIVGFKEGISAINRIGIIADERGLSCMNRNKNTHFVGLQTDPDTVEALLLANGLSDRAVVITLDRYKNNSESFWTKNSKPITNVVSLLAMIMAGAATGNSLRLRIEKSRREMAALLANGVKISTLQSIETLRVAKDTLVASVSGVIGSSAVAPFISSAVYGLQLHMSPRDVLVGAGAVVVGAGVSLYRAFGTPSRVIKIIDPSEATL